MTRMLGRWSTIALLAYSGLWFAFDVSSARGESPKGRLYFVGVAYDAAPPEGKTLDHYNYAPDNFADLLMAKSSPLFREVRVATVKGAEVTRDGVLAKLKAIRNKLNEDDVVFFYWGTHGGVDPKRGWNAGLADEGVMYAADIKRELGRLPCPVVAVVSTCGSGGFARQVSPADAPLPDNVTALCACRRRQLTGNELDVSLCEALVGFADFDNSGDVTLREAMSYVPNRYRYWNPGDEPSDQRPVLVAGQSALLDAPLAKVDGEYAAVVVGGRWYGVSVISREPVVSREVGKAKVRFLGFDHTCADGAFSRPDLEVSEEATDWAGGEPPVEVEWKKSWWPARVLSRGADGVRIHYINYPATDDETVAPSRLRYPFPQDDGEADAPRRRRAKRSD